MIPAVAPIVDSPKGAPAGADSVEAIKSLDAQLAELTEEMLRQGRQAHIIGVDPSVEALRIASRSMQEIGVKTDFIQGDATDLPDIVQEADVTFFCNAIHLLPDKLTAFRQMAAILLPGGIFACNSTFYDGAYVEGSDRFYRLWIRRAVGWLRKEYPEVRLAREDKAMARQWLKPEDGFL